MTYLHPDVPLGVVLLVLIVLFFHLRPRLTRLALAGTTLLIFLWSWPPVGRWTSYLLERNYHQDQLSGADAQAIVVLSAGVRSPTTVRHVALLDYQSYERTMHGAWLYRNRFQVPVLTAGGELGQTGHSVIVSHVMRDLLIENGVPSEMVWVEAKSLSTNQNAVNCARILKQKGIGRIVLVTDGIHLPRAIACFKKQGIATVPAPSTLRSGPYTMGWKDYIPSVDAVITNQDVLHEVIGLVWYRLSGKI